MSTIHLVPNPSPTVAKPDLEMARQRREQAERALRKAFADSLANDGWTATLETLAAELDAHRDEAGKFGWEIWEMRSRAMIELSADTDLR